MGKTEWTLIHWIPLATMLKILLVVTELFNMTVNYFSGSNLFVILGCSLWTNSLKAGSSVVSTKTQKSSNHIKAFFICQPLRQTDSRWKFFTSPSSSLPLVTFVLCGLEPRCLALNCWDPDLDRAGIVSVFCVYGPNILMCIFVFVPLAGDSIDSMISQLSPVVLSRARAPPKTRRPYGAPY